MTLTSDKVADVVGVMCSTIAVGFLTSQSCGSCSEVVSAEREGGDGGEGWVMFEYGALAIVDDGKNKRILGHPQEMKVF